MPVRLVLPCHDDREVVTEEPDALDRPELSPCEGGRKDSKELLPLDGMVLLVGLPWVMEPVALEVCSVAQCPRGVGEKLEVWCCHTVRVDKVGCTIPCGQEVGPPRDVRLCLGAQAEPVVEAPDGRAEGN